MPKRKETVLKLKHSIGKRISKPYKLNRPLSMIEIIRPKTPPEGLRPTLAERQKELDGIRKLRNRTRSQAQSKNRAGKDTKPRSGSEAFVPPIYSPHSIGAMQPAELGQMTVGPECRYREITIKECLMEICANIEETLPINGNYQFIGSVQPKIEDGDFPSFTFYPANYPSLPAEPWQRFDCASNVDFDEGAVSTGSLSIATACSITDDSKIQGIGLKFKGFIRVQQGRHSDQPGEWAYAFISSKLAIRALPSSGSLTTLYEDAPYRLSEWQHTENDASIQHDFLPVRRFIELDLDALSGYSFFIDYDLTYWLETSGGQSWACIGLYDFQIIPYIVYRKCGFEWVQVKDAIWDLASSPYRMGKKD